MTSSPLRVGILSCPGAPFIGRLISRLLENDVPVSAIILDAKGVSEVHQQRYDERTGGRLPPIPLEEFEEHAIPSYLVQNHNNPIAARIVRDLKLDMLLNSETPRILTADMLAATRIGVLNCHPGLLPAYRGSMCVEWAILNNDPVGNTVHVMSEGIDEGAIVRRGPLTFSKSDTYLDVRAAVYTDAIRLLADTAADLAHGRLSPGDFEAQGDGDFKRPMNESQLETVIERLACGTYAFQK
jgi:methionyl-tRNA formyltransferase